MSEAATSVLVASHGSAASINDTGSSSSPGNPLGFLTQLSSLPSIFEVVDDPLDDEPNDDMPPIHWAVLWSCETLSNNSKVAPKSLKILDEFGGQIVNRCYMGYDVVVPSKVIDVEALRTLWSAAEVLSWNNAQWLDAVLDCLVDGSEAFVELGANVYAGLNVTDALEKTGLIVPTASGQHNAFMALLNSEAKFTPYTLNGTTVLPATMSLAGSDPNSTLYWVYLTPSERAEEGPEFSEWYFVYETWGGE
ncbi:MAG: hypothetical protein KF812_06840 [Fimbriimonadaceae bacterium]|nr:hypothetical protein [Fimbriimonadaceae bacterium]